MSELSEMTLEARQLLRDVRAIGKKSNFLEHPFVVAGDRQPGFLNSVKQRGAISFHHVGMKRADFLEFFPDRFEPMNQILGQMFAFALSHFDQIGERSAQRPLDGRPGFFRVHGFFREPHHARRLQNCANGDLARRV